MSFKRDIIEDLIQQLLSEHNKVRSNLPKLKLNINLLQYAQNWADTMADRNILIHSKMDDVLKLGFYAAGENVAWNQDTVSYVMDSWLRSPDHKKNIMRPFTHVGFGVRCNYRNEPYWCVVFGAQSL